MKATQQLHNLGQRLWLDNVTRDLLTGGSLSRYIADLSVTGVTSNPTIFNQAVKSSTAYDATVRAMHIRGKAGEDLLFDLALEDLTMAADLFRPIYVATDGADGWVSLEVSPLLASDMSRTLAAAKDLFARAARPNLFIKIPGTPEGLLAVEEAVFSGVPVNVTLLFSGEHYIAAAEAFLRGVERRLDNGLNPDVRSVASVFVSRWDTAVAGRLPSILDNRLGIAMAKRVYKISREFLNSARWRRVFEAGARPQDLLWASTGTRNHQVSDVLYVTTLVSPFTIITIPEATLNALSHHDELGPVMTIDGGDCEVDLTQIAQAGIDIDALGAQLQRDGLKAFENSWNELLAALASKCSALGIKT